MVLLYLESFGNPRKFTRIARSITAKKPVVAVTSNRTPLQMRVSGSQTGAMATDQAATEALFKFGMGCVGCAIARGETIREAAEAHGIPLPELLSALGVKE